MSCVYITTHCGWGVTTSNSCVYITTQHVVCYTLLHISVSSGYTSVSTTNTWLDMFRSVLMTNSCWNRDLSTILLRNHCFSHYFKDIAAVTKLCMLIHQQLGVTPIKPQWNRVEITRISWYYNYFTTLLWNSCYITSNLFETSKVQKGKNERLLTCHWK